MTTKLAPPRVPPLSESQRARLRNQVMHPAVRRTPRRWAVPIAAVAAVAAVIAGATLAGHWGEKTAPPVINSPVPDAITVDLGPASAAELAKLKQSCRTALYQPADEVLWSRKVKRFASLDNAKNLTGVVALMRVSQPKAQPGHSLGILFCTATGQGDDVLDGRWTAGPTPAQGMLTIDELTYVQGGMPPNGAPLIEIKETWGMYRVRPEITRIQARWVWSGGASPWYEGVVQDGIAYADATDSLTQLPKPHSVREFRAFDKNGNPVPLS
ncbi:hypothetical protein F1D05_03080 [Kribbella qitaiheensis]|uniref:Uncharacterized protein n=1 Tax=Kribbella qitaiheensis TaxID=1544730 RepID=A0A7G6WSW0_9ACTN|nr:hypothetical protein [Kribbella qitaiheensis]QNE17075.1 hypothetical protein F1D05_03080 [Kribbella qitaiheensis]